MTEKALQIPIRPTDYKFKKQCGAMVDSSGNIVRGTCADIYVSELVRAFEKRLRDHGFQRGFSQERSVAKIIGGDSNCFRGEPVYAYGKGCMGGTCIRVDAEAPMRICPHTATVTIHVNSWNFPNAR